MSDETKYKQELQQFKNFAVYKYLEDRRSEKMRSRMSALIDAALRSKDDGVRRIAQTIREQAQFWDEFDRILGYAGIREESSPEVVDRMFRPYNDPREAETQVALDAIGG